MDFCCCRFLLWVLPFLPLLLSLSILLLLRYRRQSSIKKELPENS